MHSLSVLGSDNLSCVAKLACSPVCTLQLI